jgi:RNA polymerase sigma-70 factor (ECF subfamily)
VAHDPRTDAEIIRASLTDAEEFGEIYARHHTSVFRFVARRIGIGDAGDIAAEVFVRAFSIRARYDTTKPKSLPWLFGIGVNIVGDRLRRTRRRQRIHVGGGETEVGREISDADDRVVANQVGARLNAALEELTAKDRETLLLFALEGLSYAEIGRVLGVPAGTVGSRISRVRRRVLELIPDLEQITSRKGRADEDGL